MVVKVSRYKLAEVYYDTWDTKIFRFAPLELQLPEFKPGQFLMLYLLKEDGSPGESKPYSISSSPFQKNYVEFTVKVKGNFTQKLDKLAAGDVVGLAGPYGVFCIDETKPFDIVLIAGGVGIAPFMSMVRYASEKKLGRRITLLYSNRELKDVIFFKELKQLSSSDGVKTVFTLTREERLDGWEGESGRIDEEFIKKHVGSLGEKTFFICGSAEMAKELRAMLNRMGVDNKLIKTEDWA